MTPIFAIHFQSTMAQFSNVPTRIIGQRLTEISVPLSTDLRSYRLRLNFQSFLGKMAGNPRDNSGRSHPVGSVTNLTLEGVQTLKLLDWWYPDYPLAVLRPLDCPGIGNIKYIY